jgi:molybdate transport system substrate-binding protein
VVVAFSLLACAAAQEVRVAAAADLSAAMPALTAAFEKQTGIRAAVSLGSSGNFFAQIQNGAPFDVFLSADRGYPEKLEQAGKAEPGTMVLYGRGRLVLWAPNRLTLKFAPDDLKGLLSAAVGKVSIANPEHAPYGRAAVAALQHYGIYEQIKGKLVLGENVSQAAQFAQSGNADVAFIGLALAASESMQRQGHYVMLPQESYPPLDQAAVVLRTSRNKEAARRFLEFMTSADAQKLLRESGFESPQK